MHPPRRLRRAIVMYLAGACVLVAAEAIAPGEVHGVSPSSREAGARSPEAALGAPNAVPLPAPFRAVRPSIPPPTPEGPGNSPSPFPTVLHTPQTASHTPRMAAPEAILEDLDTGQILFERNPDSPRPIASLTKIMTALLVLRGGEPTGAATVSAAAAAQNGSTLGLRPGERPSVLALLYALMLQSSNDAAVALAENAAGTSARFVELMNRRAAALGLRHTRYFSPSGLDDRGYSTARDLAAVTRTADQVPLFQSIVATRTRDIPAPAGPPRHIQNRNVLLWLYPGATGVKTGSTPGAGSCLVATARQGDRGLVAVVLADRDEQKSFDDAASLLNYGFAGFTQQTILDQGQQLGAVAVQGWPVPVEAAEGFATLVALRSPGPITSRIIPLHGLRLPVRSGQEVGRILIEVDGRPVGTVRAVASEGIPPPVEAGPHVGSPVSRTPPRDVQRASALVASVLPSLVSAFL